MLNSFSQKWLSLWSYCASRMWNEGHCIVLNIIKKKKKNSKRTSQHLTQSFCILSILFLSIYLTELYSGSWRDICIPMFTEALFTVSKMVSITNLDLWILKCGIYLNTIKVIKNKESLRCHSQEAPKKTWKM